MGVPLGSVGPGVGEGFQRFLPEGNSLRFHQLAAQFPDAAARAVHDTFYHTLTILFNAAPPANVDPKAQHLDTIPCKLTPGILGYIAGYLGCRRTADPRLPAPTFVL